MPLTPARVLKTFRYGMLFDGVDDVVRVPNSPELQDADNLTIAMWVMSNRGLIIGMPSGFYGGVGKGYYYGFGWSGYIDGWGFYIYDGTTNQWNHAGNTPIMAGETQYVAVANENRRSEISVNAVVKSSTTFTISARRTGDPLSIGWFRAGYWYGIIYKFLLYNRGLSRSQNLWNYNNPDDPVADGLVLSLHAHPDHIRDIDNDGILEWIDLSGHGNHGKIYGARLVELVKEPARVLSPARVLAPAR